QLLSDGEIYEGRVNIPMAHVGGEIRKACLWIDTLSIPSQHAVNHEGMAQVVNARSCLAFFRLDAGAAKNPDQQMSHHPVRVPARAAIVPVPEHTSRGFYRRSRLPTSIEVRLKRFSDAVGDR